MTRLSHPRTLPPRSVWAATGCTLRLCCYFLWSRRLTWGYSFFFSFFFLTLHSGLSYVSFFLFLYCFVLFNLFFIITHWSLPQIPDGGSPGAAYVFVCGSSSQLVSLQKRPLITSPKPLNNHLWVFLWILLWPWTWFYSVLSTLFAPCLSSGSLTIVCTNHPCGGDSVLILLSCGYGGDFFVYQP